MSYSVGAHTTPAGTNVPWASLGNLSQYFCVQYGEPDTERRSGFLEFISSSTSFSRWLSPDQIFIELNISLLCGRETVKVQILICFCRGLEITTNWSLKLRLFFYFFTPFHSLQMQINFPRTNLNP